MENLCKRNWPDPSIISYYGNYRQPQHFNNASNDRISQNTRVISTIPESILRTDAIMEFAAIDGQIVIAVDCEGVNLGNQGEITLIQVATTQGEAFIFDILTCPLMVHQGGLKNLLEHDNVIKIIHDCRNDSINLHQQFGVTLRNVFDTQAAHALLQIQDRGVQEYAVKNIPLNKLCQTYRAPINPKKDQIKKVYRSNQRYWATRPLTNDMLLYAAGDVLVLTNNQLYANMAKRIKPDYRQLFSELCTEQILKLIKPDEVKIRKEQRIEQLKKNRPKVPIEISNWRSKDQKK